MAHAIGFCPNICTAQHPSLHKCWTPPRVRSIPLLPWCIQGLASLDCFITVHESKWRALVLNRSKYTHALDTYGRRYPRNLRTRNLGKQSQQEARALPILWDPRKTCLRALRSQFCFVWSVKNIEALYEKLRTHAWYAAFDHMKTKHQHPAASVASLLP